MPADDPVTMSGNAGPQPPTQAPPLVCTIGHSTRSLEEFVKALRSFGVRQVVDVRTVPRSRHNPQFDQATLPEELAEAGIGYVHRKDLGGLRHPRPDSPNGGWRNAGFRGFADYMQTPAFTVALDWLIGAARASPTAIMCAEAVPWRCHRSLIADALVIRGWTVEHIMAVGEARRHVLNPMADVRDGLISYPAPAVSAGSESAAR